MPTTTRSAPRGADTTDHDPGSEAASERAAPLEAVAAEPIEPAGRGRVLIGTASWTDAMMTGQGTETKRLPKAIREALPEELQAKSRIYLKDFPAELNDEVWRTFRSALSPLEERGQLGSSLLQYPKWVFPSNENRALIDDA